MIKCPKCGSLKIDANVAADSYWRIENGKWVLKYFMFRDSEAQMNCRECGKEEIGTLEGIEKEFDRTYDLKVPTIKGD